MEDIGATGSTYLMTLEQLQPYNETTSKSEETDKKMMNFIINPSTSGIQENLVQWATAGFIHGFQVLSVSLIRPSPCSDGQFRDLTSYVEYITGSDITSLVTNFQSHFLGIYFSYTISGNIINLHASRHAPI